MHFCFALTGFNYYEILGRLLQNSYHNLTDPLQIFYSCLTGQLFANNFRYMLKEWEKYSKKAQNGDDLLQIHTV